MKKTLRTLCLSTLLFATACSNLLYYPSDMMFYEPQQLGLVPEDIAIEVEPGVKVHGWYLKSENKKPKGVIVYFHGNAQNLSSHYVTLSWILKEGYDYFIWDYRGYGRSNGNPSPENTVHDAKIVLKNIYSRNPKLPLYVFAQSLGGAIAMRAVIDLHGEIPIKSMTVDSTFESYKSAGRWILSQHWLTWLFQPLAYVLLNDKYAPKGRVGEISPIPLQVLHGNADQVVSYKFGEEIFKDAKEPKEFFEIQDGQHIDGFWNKTASITRKKYLDFLSKYKGREDK